MGKHAVFNGNKIENILEESVNFYFIWVHFDLMICYIIFSTWHIYVYKYLCKRGLVGFGV
jgi:hypothetical protein